MASNTLIGALRAEATLESGKFVDGARKLQLSAKKTETQLQKSFGVMGASIKQFGVSLAAGLSIGLIARGIKGALDYAGSLKEVADQLGVTTKDLQVFRFAAGQVGVKQEQLETGLSKLTITLGKVAAGAKAPAKALAAIGISVDEIKGKDTGEAFRMIADGLQQVTDRSQRAAIEVALFGKSGAMLDNLLSGGSSAINELSAAAEKLGIVLSDEQIQRADETADKLDALKTVLSANIAGVVADNAESILTLANAIAEIAAVSARALANFGKLVSFISQNAAFLANPIGEIAKGRLVSSGNVRGLNRAGSSVTIDLPPAKAPKAAAGRGISQFLAPKSGGGGRRRSPRAPRDRSDDVAYQFEQEMRRAQMDTLRAQQSLVHTNEARAAIVLQLLDLQREEQEAELQDRVRRAQRDFAEGKIDAQTLQQVKAQAESLRAEYAKTDALERQAIAEDLAAQKSEDAADLADSAYDLRIEQLQNEAGLAETASERRAAELRILQVMKEQEKARLEALLADQNASELARAQAQQRLDELDNIYASRAENVVQGTRGPMEDWLASLPTTAAKAQEAFEQLEVQGFEGLIDAAVALTDGFDSAKDALLSTLKQFLQGLLRMQLQQLAGSAFSQAGGLGSIFGSIFSSAASSYGGGSFGSGIPGAMSFSGNPLVPGFASGGFTGWSSGIAGYVHGREGVLNTRGLMTLGIPNLEALNRGAPLSAVSNDNDTRSRTTPGSPGDIHNHYHGVTDFDSFRRNERQMARSTRRTLGIKQ